MKVLEMKNVAYFSKDAQELLEELGIKYREVADNVLEISKDISQEGAERLSKQLAMDNVGVENIYAYSKVNKDIVEIQKLFSQEKRNTAWLFDEDLYHLPVMFTFDDFNRNIVSLQKGISQRYFNEIKLAQMFAGFYLLRRELRRESLPDAVLLSDERELFIERVAKVYDLSGDYHETLEKIRFIGIQVGEVFPTFVNLDAKIKKYIEGE